MQIASFYFLLQPLYGAIFAFTSEWQVVEQESKLGWSVKSKGSLFFKCFSVFNATLNTRRTLSHLFKLCGKVFLMLSSPVHTTLILHQGNAPNYWHDMWDVSINILPPPDTYSGEGHWTWACRRRVFGTLSSIAVTWRRPFSLKVILVSSSRHPDQWIVPGGGMEPEEEPCGAAIREVYEEVSITQLNIMYLFFYIFKFIWFSKDAVCFLVYFFLPWSHCNLW